MEGGSQTYIKWIFLTVMVPVYFAQGGIDYLMPGGMEDIQVLDMRCDMQPIYNGRSMTLQEICGNISIVVHNISSGGEPFPFDSFPWELTLTLATDDSDPPQLSTKTVIINEADLNAGDNITGLVLNKLGEFPEPRFQVHMGNNDNRVGTGTITLSSAGDPGRMVYTADSKFTVLTDFSGMNVMLEQIGDIQPSYDLVVDGTATMSSVFQENLADINNKVYLSGNVPQLEPMDTCIFAVVYLAPKEESGGSWVTPNLDCIDNYMVPRFTTSDTLVGTPICYNSNSQAPVDLLEIVRLDDNPINPASICGAHTMVFQVDPLDTMGNEQDKCDNYITIDVNFKCDLSLFEGGTVTTGHGSPISYCGLYLNPFGNSRNDLFEARFKHTSLYFINDTVTQHQFNKYTKLIKYDKYGWHQSLNEPLEVEGYAAVEIFTKYIKSTYQSSYCDNLATDADLKAAVNELEGLQEVYEESNMATLGALYSDFALKIDNMKADPTTGIQQIIDDANVELESLSDMSLSTRIAKSAANATISIAKAIQNNNIDGMKLMASHNACYIAHELEALSQSIVYILHDSGNAKMWMEDIARNLSRVVLTLRYFYPGFTCLENNLRMLVKNIEQFSMPVEEMTIDWMYDSKQVQEILESGKTMFNRNYCHTTSNSCIKKLKTMCTNIRSDDVPEDIGVLKDKVCMAKFIKEKAKQQFKSLGLHRIRTFINNHDSCSRDPVEPSDGSFILYKTENGMLGSREVEYMFKGTPTLDNSGYFWRKIAVCNCEACVGPHK